MTAKKTSARLENASLSKSDVDKLIESGAIREDYLQLVKGFNADYDVSSAPSHEMKSFRTQEMFEMPKFIFSNDSHRFTVWGTTLLNSIIMKDYKIKCNPIAKAKGLPVFFRDEFLEEFTNIRKVSDIRSTDGGIDIFSRYRIVGAIVSKSKVDPTRWSVSPKMYDKGNLFLESERIRLNKPALSWISEERLIEISKADKADRTYVSGTTTIVLPAFNELKIVGNADTDVRWASAQFLIELI